MTSTLIGYARTSTADQKAGLDAQLRDLEAAGCTKLFSEQLSSKASQRPELERAFDYVREGDVLVVTKLDRLARSVADFHAIAERLKTKGVALRVMSMGGERFDSYSSTGNLMLNLLSAIAQFERELMLERQREGIATAKAEGRYKGRAPTARRKADKVLALKAEGKTPAEIQAALSISKASYFRILKAAA